MNNKLIKTIGSSKDKNEIEILYQEALKLIPQLIFNSIGIVQRKY